MENRIALIQIDEPWDFADKVDIKIEAELFSSVYSQRKNWLLIYNTPFIWRNFEIRNMIAVARYKEYNNLLELLNTNGEVYVNLIYALNEKGVTWDMMDNEPSSRTDIHHFIGSIRLKTEA